MIRYTSDPVDNVKLFLKTYAIPDKSFNFMSDATLSGANPEIEKQPGVAPYTALRLPEWDPYKVMQNSYVGPFNNSELIDKGEGLIETPYQTDLQKSNIAAENPERLKQITLIQQELDRLDKEEAKYNQERQAKRDYYNSDAFLAKVYKLDPKTAEFLAGRKQAGIDKTLEESKIANNYNIASLKLGDVTKKDKLELQQLWKDNTRALEGARARGESQGIINTYAENIDRLVKQLQAIDPATWGEAGEAGEAGDTGTGVISTSDIDAAKAEAKVLIDAAKDVKNDKGENKSDGIVDNISDIKASIRALKDKYKISEKDIDDIFLNLTDKEDEIKAMHTASRDEDQLAYERSKDRLDNTIAGWKSAVNDWKTIRSKAKSALINFKNANLGAGQTIALKALLGDALSEQERSVMQSKGYGESLFGGIWSGLTKSSTPVSKTDAEKIIRGLVDFVNSLSNDFKGFTNNKYVLDGLGLSKDLLVPLTMNDGKTLDAPKKGDKKTVYGITMTFDGKIWR